MKNLIIFDLKGTLVSDNREVTADSQKLLDELRQSNSELWLYSIIEPWTLEVLSRYSQLAMSFSKIILVKNKVDTDVASAKTYQDNVWVVGDGIESEIDIAKKLGYNWLIICDTSSSIYEMVKPLREAVCLT